MWNKSVASLLLGTLLLVGCSNNNATEPLNNETTTPGTNNVDKNLNNGTNDVGDDVQKGINEVQEDVNKGVNDVQQGVEDVVPGDNNRDNTLTDNTPNDGVTPNPRVTKENIR